MTKFLLIWPGEVNGEIASPGVYTVAKATSLPSQILSNSHALMLQGIGYGRLMEGRLSNA